MVNITGACGFWLKSLSFLRDDFMLGAKMRDWDKEDENVEQG
jgi:hypothetical protein